MLCAIDQRTRVGNLTICYRKNKLTSIFLTSCPVIDNKLRHNIAKVVCRSTRLSPYGFTATLTMLHGNSLSITRQAHENPTSICLIVDNLFLSSHLSSRKHCFFSYIPICKNNNMCLLRLNILH